MTRIDSVRAATGSAKDSVLHAAEVVAPYADTAKEKAAHYAQEARVRLAPKVSQAAELLAPKVSQAAEQARVQYDAHLAPRLEQARTHVPPKVDHAAHEAALRTRVAARQAAEYSRQAADYSRPRLEQAVAAAGPVRDEAASRGAAALAALRGQVTPAQIDRLVRANRRRARAGRAVKGLAVLGVLAGGTYAAWRWWERQANPDWLVEPPAATEVPAAGGLKSVDNTGLDPEVEAKEAEAAQAETQQKKHG
ncbi:DUF5324 family protein [Streptomyces acidiscabies]|uniref:DUF5324 family protein n=7 Tax=Streptomyces acidiscabies TaxID=42234 RepID=A0AAP6BL17_9ACTN|nr:DUF5324 family protein [Streptomyces acidiscabies]MBP5938268.1 transcriptional regulator [Streptomyces sp. LBUM 1476]MBZ3909292.1 DUF5324 family protein [Streptomyces acidiscabies]MDX2966702.1 DUF5324 family protein [Streptomyces acidiscabies]MDX3016300.1 DUF5324 family protein [Streptomyces acidiscabies]MDX3788794.1 DUF5324 family protein [Streptomyces acidiscabies]